MKNLRFVWICLAFVAAGCGGTQDPAGPRDAAARWVFSKGGRLVVAGKTGEIRSPQELPAGDFSIDKIILNESRIADGELAQLRELKNLRSLSLYRTGIGDAGIEHLAGMTSLQELELSYTGISDEGIKKLTGLTKLKKLFLRGTSERVTAGGIKTFREALPQCEIFR